jgi:hypothetical protein
MKWQSVNNEDVEEPFSGPRCIITFIVRVVLVKDNIVSENCGCCCLFGILVLSSVSNKSSKIDCLLRVRGATQKFPKFECRSLTT